MSKKNGVIVVGAAGRMGRMICQAVNKNPKMLLVGATEHPEHSAIGKDIGEIAGFSKLGVYVQASFEKAISQVEADVVIDFTTPDATRDLMLKVAEYNDHTQTDSLAMVIGTTGLSKPTLAMIKDSIFPCVQATNMSVGANVMFKLVEQATSLLGEGYDKEIFELHHRKKKDAPSGTAGTLAERVVEGEGRDLTNVYTRHTVDDVRGNAEIGISAARGGTVPGTHTVFFLGDGEQFEITHRAESRNNFVGGAIRSAEWVVNQPNGRYDMFDVLGLKEL